MRLDRDFRNGNQSRHGTIGQVASTRSGTRRRMPPINLYAAA